MFFNFLALKRRPSDQVLCFVWVMGRLWYKTELPSSNVNVYEIKRTIHQIWIPTKPESEIMCSGWINIVFSMNATNLCILQDDRSIVYTSKSWWTQKTTRTDWLIFNIKWTVFQLYSRRGYVVCFLVFFLLTIVLSVFLQFTASDLPFGIFKHFLQTINHIGILMWDFECKLRLLQGRGGVVPRSGETIVVIVYTMGYLKDIQ